MKGNIVILVLTSGFVMIGREEVAMNGFVALTEASCIRRWGTERGLGQLALEGATPSTVLDPCGELIAPLSAVIMIIRCREGAWPTLP